MMMATNAVTGDTFQAKSLPQAARIPGKMCRVNKRNMRLSELTAIVPPFN